MKEKVIPMIGQQQQPFDVSQAIQQNCKACGGEYFDIANRIKLISAIAPGNRTGQQVIVKFEAYLCRACGGELGKEVTKQ